MCRSLMNEEKQEPRPFAAAGRTKNPTVRKPQNPSSSPAVLRHGAARPLAVLLLSPSSGHISPFLREILHVLYSRGLSKDGSECSRRNRRREGPSPFPFTRILGHQGNITFFQTPASPSPLSFRPCCCVSSPGLASGDELLLLF